VDTHVSALNCKTEIGLKHHLIGKQQTTPDQIEGMLCRIMI
jgi:hypothetical protein